MVDANRSDLSLLRLRHPRITSEGSLERAQAKPPLHEFLALSVQTSQFLLNLQECPRGIVSIRNSSLALIELLRASPEVSGFARFSQSPPR